MYVNGIGPSPNSIWKPVRLLSPDGFVRQAWNRFMRHVQNSLEVMRVDNVEPNMDLEAGHIVALVNVGGQPRGVQAFDNAKHNEYAGVMAEPVKVGKQGICRNANVALVKLIDGLAPAHGDKVWTSSVPGKGILIPEPTSVFVGTVIDKTMYDGVAGPNYYPWCQVQLRWCCPVGRGPN